MWSTNKKDRCLRSALLTINCAACIAIIYMYVTYVGQNGDVYGSSHEAFIKPEKLIDEKCIPVCDSKACIWHANMLLKNVNSTADPCENFHTFLCGGLLKKYGRDEKGTVVLETGQLMMKKLKDILDNLQAESGSASAKMKTVYDSCINYGSSELLGITELKNFLNSLGFSDWPYLTQDFNFGDVNLSTILGNYMAYGSVEYIDFYRVAGNETQDDGLRITVSSYTFNRTSKIARELAVSMLKYFDLEAENIVSIIKDHEFVRNSILDLFQNNKDCRSDKCPYFYVDCSRHIDDDWIDFCGTVRVYLDFLNLKKPINASSIIIQEPEEIIFKKLFSLFRSFPNRSLANFISLSFIEKYQAELNFYFRLSKLKKGDFKYEYLKDYYELDRWRFCIQWIVDHMKLPLMNEFLHQYLTNAVTEEVISIYNDHLLELIDLITLQESIPAELKLKLAEKMKNITFNINYIRRILPNDSYANEVYEKFLPTSESFFKNVLQQTIFNLDIPVLRNHFNNYNLKRTDFEVQANAHFEEAIIEMHYGMLLPPFYKPNHTSLMNHVLLVAIMGHELGHHLLYNIFEQNPGEGETLLEKTQCVRDQFSRFKFEHLNENLEGSRYLSENLPDNVATSLIDKLVDKHSASEDIILPGLPYSTKQLLYMSATQVWCGKSNLERDLLHQNLVPYPPDKYRVIGMMQNSRGYPKAFQCPAGSFMNPESKCSILDSV